LLVGEPFEIALSTSAGQVSGVVQNPNCGVGLTSADLGDAKPKMGQRVFGIERNGALAGGHGLAPLLLVHEHQAEIALRLVRFAVETDGLAELDESLIDVLVLT
jgi:hypothetical protein